MTDPLLPEVQEIRRLSIQPADRLVVRLGSLAVSTQMAADMQRRVRAVLNLPDIPVMIIGAEDEVTVLEGDPS